MADDIAEDIKELTDASEALGKAEEKLAKARGALDKAVPDAYQASKAWFDAHRNHANDEAELKKKSETASAALQAAFKAIDAAQAAVDTARRRYEKALSHLLWHLLQFPLFL